jgi:hypothetical protein
MEDVEASPCQRCGDFIETGSSANFCPRCFLKNEQDPSQKKSSTSPVLVFLVPVLMYFGLQVLVNIAEPSSAWIASTFSVPKPEPRIVFLFVLGLPIFITIIYFVRKYGKA